MARLRSTIVSAAVLAMAALAFARAPSEAHPLRLLALAASDVPRACELEPTTKPMLMLPTDETWKRDVKMTVGWWIPSDRLDAALDAALSHMLDHRGEPISESPAVLVSAMRFKDPAAARSQGDRLTAEKPGLRASVQGRVLVIFAPKALAEDCAAPLWRELQTRLSRLAS